MGIMDTIMAASRATASGRGVRSAGQAASMSGSGGIKAWGQDMMNTRVSQGMYQHLGMAGAGAAAGGFGALLSGGSVGQGIVLGGLAGAAGGAYSPQIVGGFKQGAGRIQHLRQGRALTQYRGAKRAGDTVGAEQAKAKANAFRQSRKNIMSSSSYDRALATAAGAGLASGLFASGHRRKQVNSFNGNRGNYIGGM
jgi:hypothetical protein